MAGCSFYKLPCRNIRETSNQSTNRKKARRRTNDDALEFGIHWNSLEGDVFYMVYNINEIRAGKFLFIFFFQILFYTTGLLQYECLMLRNLEYLLES